MTERDLERMDEMEISIKDLLMYICLHWRGILVWMLVGAVLLGGVGVWKAYSDVKAVQSTEEMSEETPKQSKDIILQKMRESLSESEVAEVEYAFKAYEGVIRNCEGIAKYNNESIKMQLNPYEVPTVNLSYFIDNHYQAVYPVVEGRDNTVEIIAALQEDIMDTVTLDKILQELGWKIDVEYVSELMTIRSNGGMLYIGIMAPTEKECGIIRDVVMERINIRSEEIRDVFGEFDIELIGNQYEVAINQTLSIEQTSMDYSIYNLKNNYAGLESTLSEEQKEYLDELKKLQFQSENEKKADESRGADIPNVNLLQKKYVLMGIVLGVFFYCLWLVLKYIASGKLHAAEEMEWRYHINVLATIEDGENVNKKKKTVFDQFLYDVFSKEEVKLPEEVAIRVIRSEICTLARNAEMKKIYVASTCGTKKCAEIRQLVCQKVENVLYVIYEGDEVNYKAEELEMLGESDGVVLVEQKNISLYKNIKRLVYFCNKNHVSLIGCVVVE